MGKCLGTCWFTGSWRMDRGPHRVPGPPLQLQNYFGGIQLLFIQWVIRQRQILVCFFIFLGGQNASAWAILHLSNKAIHVWFMLPCHSFVTQTFAMWGSAGCSDNFWLFSLPEKWGWSYTACACFLSILFHTVYLILVLAVSFVLLCRSAFEPGLGVRLKPSQPHTWFLK